MWFLDFGFSSLANPCGKFSSISNSILHFIIISNHLRLLYPETIMGTLGMRWEYSLDGKLVHCRTHSHLCIVNPLTSTYQETGKPGVKVGRTHSNWNSGSNQVCWNCESATLPIEPVCLHFCPNIPFLIKSIKSSSVSAMLKIGLHTSLHTPSLSFSQALKHWGLGASHPS